LTAVHASLRAAIAAAALTLGTLPAFAQDPTPPPAPEPAAAPAPAEAPAAPEAPPAPPPAPPAPPTPEELLAALAAEGTAGGLQVTELKPGAGAQALPGSLVVVHYTGWLLDTTRADGKGAKFDSSRDRKEPFVFPLGARRVIRGWDIGVAGLRPGGRRLLVIPPKLAYGEREFKDGDRVIIPSNATLVFDVELLAIDPVR
jgi:FKBP-type peptidyl-prolyl cis-trans isomerase FkpA